MGWRTAASMLRSSMSGASPQNVVTEVSSNPPKACHARFVDGGA